MNIEHIKKLDQGKQGITGLLKKDGKVYVYKISQYMNHLPHHEFLILNGLKELTPYCPHFCGEVELIRCPIHPHFKQKEQNPFDTYYKMLELDVLLMEYIEDAVPLYNMVKEKTIPMSVLMGTIKQTLMAILIAQKQRQFVHYDLHAMNVLVKETSFDDVHVYVLGEGNAVAIPTYGFKPMIIDFGFSASKDLENHPAYISLAYTDSGYASPAFDPIADSKILLVSLAEDFKECRPRFKYTTKFRNLVKNFFEKLDISWKSGWDKHKEPPIINQIFEEIQNKQEKSALFSKYPHICMDIFQCLVRVPYQPKIVGTVKELKRAYKVFVHEFRKIETEINNTFYSLYVFRCIMDAALELRDMYFEGRVDEAVLQFQRRIFDAVNTVAKFCTMKNVHYDVLLCAVYALGEQLEYQLQEKLQTYLTRKRSEYQKMRIQSLDYMFAILDVNFKETYTYHDRTRIHVMDMEKGTTRVYSCSEETSEFLETLHQLPHYARGNFLVRHYAEKEGK